jgi:hypothetical protein
MPPCRSTTTQRALQDTVQTVQALKAASSQMKGAMKNNKELDLNFIDSLQVLFTGGCVRACVWGLLLLLLLLLSLLALADST